MPNRVPWRVAWFQISPGKFINLLPIYLLHLPVYVSGSVGLRFVMQTRPHTSASYAVPVRQTGSLSPASFRFHLAVDTLAFDLRFPLPCSQRTFTSELMNVPGAH